jgi:hypothetical protein
MGGPKGTLRDEIPAQSAQVKSKATQSRHEALLRVYHSGSDKAKEGPKM